MAKVYLESTDTAFTVSNNNTTVFGANGDQVVTVASGVTGTTYDQGVERIVFAGATSSYTYVQAGNSILVYSGTTLVATIPTQGDTDGTKLTFTDGTVSAINTAGVMSFGGVTVSSTAAAAVTPTTIDTTVKSTVTGGTSTVTGNEAAVSYVLTTAQDTPVGGSTDEYFRAVAGSANGTQDQTTLNSSDIVDGGAGNDTLIVNLTGGSYAGGARVKNIETLQIGTNDTTARTFDYNVNMGTNEISEVTTIRYDQINTGEELSVNNILKTGTAIPTILWDNEASSTAGDINVAFRTSATDGASTLTVQLDDVRADVNTATTGQLDIASGIETINLNSQGSGYNTLNANDQVIATGVNVDLSSGTAGSLTKVVLTGAQAIGKAATVITTTTDAEYGYTNRAAASDLGIENTDSSVKGTASNLLSVDYSVAEVNASAMTAATNVRFTANTVSGATKDVTFKGGSAADYVEFEAGKVTATGGEGADTFAFINALTANSGFDSTDVLTGGAGSDTIQLGVNGVGTYTLNTTEFSNKSGIDALDLRGKTNTITLSDGFVSGADSGTTFTVYTNKIIQTSDTDTANPSSRTAGDNRIEDNSVTTLDTTAFAQNRAFKYQGGSGSDRLIMDNDSYNQYVTLAGGTNVVNDAATTAATIGDYDTLTIVNGANLDAGDLANTSGFESMVLTDTTSGAQAFQITLTEAFIAANTASSNSSSTDIDDTDFYIVTDNVTTTGGAVLAAGDSVQIDITDLFTSAGVYKTTLTGRTVDVSSIVASGATVSYIYAGSTLTSTDAKIATATNGTNTATAASTSAAALVGNDTGIPVTVALTAGSTFTGTAGVNDNFTGTYASLSSTTVTGTATDTETLTITDAVAAAIGGGTTAGTITNIDNLVLANVANTVTFGGTTGITSITGGTAADTITLGTLGATVSANLGTGNDTLTMTTATAYTGTFNGGDGADTLKVDTSTATDISGATVTNFETLTLTTGVAGAGLTVDSSVNLGQFTTLKDDATNAAFKISITSGSHDISGATLGFNTTTADIFDVATGASLTIAGDTQATAANYTFTGAGTLITTGSLTLNAADTISNVTLSASGLTLTDRAASTTIVGSTGADTIDMQTTTATGAKTVNLGSGGADSLRIDADTVAVLTTITGWTTAATIDLDDTTGVTGTMVTAATLAATTAVAGAATNLYIFDTATSQITGALTEVVDGGAVETAIIRAAITSSGAATTEVYVALDNGTDTGVYRLATTGAAGLLDLAADFSVTHVATITGVLTSALASNDFA